MRGRRLQIRIDHRIAGGTEGGGLREAGRFRGGRRERGQIGEASAALAEIGVDSREGGAGQIRQNGGGNHEVVDAVVGDAVVGADGSLAGTERIPGETEGGSEVAS